METLSIDPSLPFEVTEEYAVDQTDGPVVRIRHQRHPRYRRRFRVIYDLLSIADKSTVVTLFRTMKGRAGRFLFTPPNEETALECKFERDDLGWTAENPVVRSMSVDFFEAY